MDQKGGEEVCKQASEVYHNSSKSKSEQPVGKNQATKILKH
jgi:hypothetical protein